MSGLKAVSQMEPAESQATMRGFDEFDVRLGDLMRGERATMGKSLLDVQRDLRIRAAYIAAIENCDISAFDTASFVAGYVRSYARYLGMDPDETFHQFCAEAGFQPPHGLGSVGGASTGGAKADSGTALGGINPSPLYLPAATSGWSGIDLRAVGSFLVLVLLIGGLGFGGWTVLKEVQKVGHGPVDDMPEIITALDPTQEISAIPEEDMLIGLEVPGRGLADPPPRPRLFDTPELAMRDSPISAIDPGLGHMMRSGLRSSEKATSRVPPLGLAASLPLGIDALMNGGAGSDAALESADVAMVYGPQLPDAYPVAVNQGAGVEILAARPAWVRVTAVDGTVLLEKTMDAGEAFTLPELEQPPHLRAGNSGAVYFRIDGRTYGPAAPGAQVVKEVELSPKALTERFALADPSQDRDLAQLITVASADAPPAEEDAN